MPSASISLVREHSEAMQPPRALWVPFMLGRPLGAPHQPEFQRAVLLALLELFELDDGPVILRDFPAEAPAIDIDPAELDGAACPISFTAPAAELPATLDWRDALRREIGQFQTWHDLAVRRRGGSALGVSGLGIEAIADLLGEIGNASTLGLSSSDALGEFRTIKLACDDLRTFYEEAASVLPGSLDSEQVQSWFYERTVAGRIIRQVRALAMASADPAVRTIGSLVIVPRAITSQAGYTDQ